MTQPAPPAQQQTTTGQKTAILAGLLASTVPLVGLVAGFATTAGIPKVMARRLIEQAPSVPVLAQGPAAKLVAAAEPTFRAAYLLAAADRVRQAVAAGKTLEEALAAEQRHTLAHLNAQRNRAATAAAVDLAAVKHRSGLLGWKAVMDSRTSAECRSADGKNFSIFSPPVIGLPGSVHPHCRCRPVAAFEGAGLVGEQQLRKVATA